MASDAYYGAGSDDFRGYVWKIPETPMLLEQRREIGAERWPMEGGETVGTWSEVLMVACGDLLSLSICEICPGDTVSTCFSFTATVPLEW